MWNCVAFTIAVGTEYRRGGGDEAEGDADLPARRAVARIAPDRPQLQHSASAPLRTISSVIGFPPLLLHELGELR